MNALDITQTRGGMALPDAPPYDRAALAYGLSLDIDAGAPLVNAYDEARGLNMWTVAHAQERRRTLIFVEQIAPHLWSEEIECVSAEMAAALAPLLWQWLEAPTPVSGMYIVDAAVRDERP